jgi:hypothetical protein
MYIETGIFFTYYANELAHVRLSKFRARVLFQEPPMLKRQKYKKRSLGGVVKWTTE